MKKLSVCLLFLGACNTGLPDPRLQVGPDLHAACNGWGVPSAQVEQILADVEESRLGGMSKVDAARSLVEDCGQQSNQQQIAACMACSAAVVQQIYGD